MSVNTPEHFSVHHAADIRWHARHQLAKRKRFSWRKRDLQTVNRERKSNNGGVCVGSPKMWAAGSVGFTPRGPSYSGSQSPSSPSFSQCQLGFFLPLSELSIDLWAPQTSQSQGWEGAPQLNCTPGVFHHRCIAVVFKTCNGRGKTLKYAVNDFWVVFKDSVFMDWRALWSCLGAPDPILCRALASSIANSAHFTWSVKHTLWWEGGREVVAME